MRRALGAAGRLHVNTMRSYLGLIAIAALITSACAGRTASATQLTITIHYSHYTPGRVIVTGTPAGTVTLINEDPIEHEWIVGPPEVHERHRTGTEPYHDTIPTEVTVPALSTRVTTITFEKPLTWQYICHLPGHEAYGMAGTLVAR